jgi:hypothetical protein
MNRAEVNAKIVQISGGDDWIELFELRALRRQDDIIRSRKQGRRWPISVLCALLEGQAGEFRAWLDALAEADPEVFERVWERAEPQVRAIVQCCEEMAVRAQRAQHKVNGHANGK